MENLKQSPLLQKVTDSLNKWKRTMSDLLQESKAETQPTPEFENEAGTKAKDDIDNEFEVEDVVTTFFCRNVSRIVR